MNSVASINMYVFNVRKQRKIVLGKSKTHIQAYMTLKCVFYPHAK